MRNVTETRVLHNSLGWEARCGRNMSWELLHALARDSLKGTRNRDIAVSLRAAMSSPKPESRDVP